MPKKNTNQVRGEGHGRSILRAHEVVRLRSEPGNQRLTTRLLQKVSRSTLDAARTGKTWAHLNPVAKPQRSR